MEKKYILTDEVKEVIVEDIQNRSTACILLHRIKAIKDFELVKTGDIGGWVESENNLSQEATCWVHDEASVMQSAIVSDNAQILNNACVSESADIRGSAVISGNAKISGLATVCENAMVCDNAQVFGDAHISGNALIADKTIICELAEIGATACLLGSTCIFGDANIFEKGTFRGSACIKSKNDFLIIPVLDSLFYRVTFFRTDNGDVEFCFRDVHKNIREFPKMHIMNPGYISQKLTDRIYEQAVKYFGLDTKNNKKTIQTPDWIYSDCSTTSEENDIFNKIEKALGFKLFYWQKYFIRYGEYRCTGATTAEIIRLILQADEESITLQRSKNPSICSYNQQFIDIYSKLKETGLPLRKVIYYEVSL